MLCAILKRPDEIPNMEIEIEFEGEPISGIQRAVIKRPKGRTPKSLKRLSTFSWSRNHCYGYIRLRSEELYKIDGIEGGTVGGKTTLVYLVAMVKMVGAKDGKAIEKCVEVFREAHSSPGCGPTDAAMARKARRKSEMKATAE